MSNFGNFRGLLKQVEVKANPGSAPMSLKQVLRVNKDNEVLEHKSYWTLRLMYFAYGEVVNGEFWKKDDKPAVIFTWSTPSTKAYNKDKTSDVIFDPAELDNYIQFFTPESALGQHFIRFKELYLNEWNLQLYKWAKHHYRQRLIMPRYCPDHIADQVIASFENNG